MVRRVSRKNEKRRKKNHRNLGVRHMQYRICTLGDYDNYYSAFLYGTMEGAIRCGAWFRPITLFGQPLSETEKQIKWFKPHILLCHMIFNRRPHNREDVFEMLRRIKRDVGTVIFYHAGDARERPRYEGDISDIVDFGLCNHMLLDLYSSIWKIPCFHWPYMAFQQNRILDEDPSSVFYCDVAFTGGLAESGHHGPRTKFIEELKNKLDVKVFPTPETGNTRFQTTELSASARVVLGFQMGENIPGYLDVRPWQYIGSGALYFHTKCESMDNFFKDGEHYISYDKNDVESFIDAFDRCMLDKKKSDLIRSHGFHYTQTFHDTKMRMRNVIDIYEGKEPILYYINK